LHLLGLRFTDSAYDVANKKYDQKLDNDCDQSHVQIKKHYSEKED